MSKKDYREKIEEHRQSIDMEEQPNSRMSRTRRHNGKQKTSKFSFLKFLTFIMIGIPLMILVYVSFFYSPKEKEVVEVVDGSVVELQTNNTASASENDNEVQDIEKAQDHEQVKADMVAKYEAQQSTVNDKQIAEETDIEKPQVGEDTVHTVQANENLFRIAMRYYNDPSGVQKIKAANHLASDSISVGQSLIIP